jgi:hypothetical protein
MACCCFMASFLFFTTKSFEIHLRDFPLFSLQPRQIKLSHGLVVFYLYIRLGVLPWN